MRASAPSMNPELGLRNKRIPPSYSLLSSPPVSLSPSISLTSGMSWNINQSALHFSNMIENTLLNKSGARPAGEHSKTGHSNKQHKQQHWRKGKMEMGVLHLSILHPSIYPSSCLSDVIVIFTHVLFFLSIFPLFCPLSCPLSFTHLFSAVLSGVWCYTVCVCAGGFQNGGGGGWSMADWLTLPQQCCWLVAGGLEGAPCLSNELPQEEALLCGRIPLSVPGIKLGLGLLLVGEWVVGSGHFGVLGGRVSGYFSPLLAAKPCGLRVSR